MTTGNEQVAGPVAKPPDRAYNPREGEELKRIHLWLYTRDIDRLHALYGSTVGISKAVRLMVRKFLDNLEAKAAAIAEPVKGEEQDV